jgi:ketosteroid isomerase-like protein
MPERAEAIAADDAGSSSRSPTRAYGDTAVVTARVTNTAHFDGRQFDADEWTTDVLVRRGGRWLCVLSHITAAAPAG